MGNIDTQGGGNLNPNLYVNQQQTQGVGDTQGVVSNQNLQKDYVIDGKLGFVGAAQQTRSAAEIMGLPPPNANENLAACWLAAPYMIARLDITAKNIAQEMLAKRDADVIAGKEMTSTKELADAQAACTQAAALADALGHVAAAAGSAVSAGAGAKNIKDAHTLDTAEKTKMHDLETKGTAGNDQIVIDTHQGRLAQIKELKEAQGRNERIDEDKLKNLQNEHSKHITEQQMQVRHESTTAKDLNSQRADLIKALGQASAGLGQAITTMTSGYENAAGQQIQGTSSVNDKSLEQMTKSRDSMDQAISDAINALNQFIQAYGQAFRFTRN